MKKTIKILFVFLFTFALFSIWNKVEANSIQSISMDIFVDDNGNANVTEVWKCNVTQGTEVYHPYYNLGNSVIKDLTVMDGSTQYEQLSYWNTSGTLESKANKSGINQLSNGVELCWGISKYGSHTYTAKYTITNFVSETSDAQMIYWTLIPYEFSNSIGSAYIKIHTNFDIADTTDVWGYGNYGGTAYVYDGYIEMQSDGTLATDEYMTILVKFPLGTFNTMNRLDNDFEHYYDMAEENAVKYNKSFSYFLINALPEFFDSVILIVGFIIIQKMLSKYISYNDKKLDLSLAEKRIPKNVAYFKDIPCDKDIYRAYYIGFQYNIIRNKANIVGAIILKWLKDGMIRIEEGKTSKEDIVIVLKDTDSTKFEDSRDRDLYRLLDKASKDGYLERKEFKKWCKKNYSDVAFWFDRVFAIEKRKLMDEGLIKIKDIVKNGMVINKKLMVTPELKHKAVEIAGLKRYLNEYTYIKEREVVEVQLFEEYLIFAQLVGIAKKVSKQFKNTYPEIIEKSSFLSYNYICFINSSFDKEISSAQSRADSYSSGGGGYSSGGGGGDSFGGGGGGRRFPLKTLKISENNNLI